jgi:hypothetical protein
MSAASSSDTSLQELLRCAASPVYFVNTYCQIYDSEVKKWIPFRLWPEQVEAIRAIHTQQLFIALKSRQVGFTWLALAYGLWQMLYRPIAEVLLFSRREDEALYLLSHERMMGMYRRLPDWMQSRGLLVDAASHVRMANGSGARAFPSNAGDSYTATLAIIDEADLVPDFDRLLTKVQPTVEAGGKLVMLSRADKSRPQSQFKRIYRGGKAGENNWGAMFIPWYAHPGRTQAWYEQKRRETLANTGSLDDLFEQYPATDIEALSGKSLDKRISPEWLSACYEVRASLSAEILRREKAPGIPGLKVYRLPQAKRLYCAGVDPAEGNPSSDDSAAVFLDEMTGEEVALLSGKFEPDTFAGYVDQVGQWYNRAALMVERNNHGHAILSWLRSHSKLRRLPGWDYEPGQKVKEGWLSSARGKALLYNGMADAARDKETIIHSDKCYYQLSSIEGATLRAPQGEMDDCADAYALAVQARNRPRGSFVG